MKLLKNLLIVGAVLLSMAFGVEAAGPLGGLVSGSLAYTGLQIAGLVEVPSLSLLMGVSVGNIKRQDRQADNLGGFTKMIIMLPEDFTAHWPLKTQITAMKVTVAPTVTTGKTWGQMVFDLDTGSMKCSRKGKINNSNWGHEVSAQFSGVTDEQFVELDKTKGGCIIIGYDQDGRKWLAGSTKRPIELEIDGDLGAKPDSGRMVTIKGKQDGFSYPLLLLDDALTLTLTALTTLD